MDENRNRTSLDKLMGFINKAGNAVMMNLLFLVSCLPVVTIGAAWSGLYSAVRFNIRGESWFAGYKKGFKTRFFRNLILWILILFVGYTSLTNVLDYLAFILEPNDPYLVGDCIHLAINGVFLLAAMLFSAAALPVNLYIPTDVSRWIRNSWYMVFHAPLRTLAVAVLMWLPVALVIFFTQIAYLTIMVFVAAYFALCAVVMTILVKKPLLVLLERERENDPNFEEDRLEELED